MADLEQIIGHGSTITFDANWDGIVANFSADATSSPLTNRTGLPVRDASPSFSTGEADVTHYLSGGYKEFIPALCEGTVSFELIWYQAGFDGTSNNLLDLWKDRTTAGWKWAFVDASAGASDQLNFYFRGFITSLDISAPNEGEVTCNMSLRLTTANSDGSGAFLLIQVAEA